ncbi:MAG: hypothetical protein HUU15_11180 [Candidatus Brocadiae bacterium]|nr:hypothetical protein [Candidatus Brocadiia bacterium]
MRRARWAVVVVVLAISGCTRSYDVYRGSGSSESGEWDGGGSGDASVDAGRRARGGASVTWGSESHSRGIGSSSYSREQGVLVIDPGR